MPKKKGGKKDSITGMRIGNGLTILSDKTYAHDSPEIEKLVSESDATYSPDGGTEWEFEFSKKAIIISSKTTNQLTIQGQEQTTPNWSRRTVGIGKFKADKNGMLKKATIKESSDWNWHPEKLPTTTHGGSPASDLIMGFKNKSKLTAQKIEIYPIGIVIALTAAPASYEYDSMIDASLASQYNTFDEFKSLKSSKYFENGWWDNPIETNLI